MKKVSLVCRKKMIQRPQSDVSAANDTLFNILLMTCSHFTDISRTPKPKAVKSEPRTPGSEAPSAKKVKLPCHWTDASSQLDCQTVLISELKPHVRHLPFSFRSGKKRRCSQQWTNQK